MAFILTHVLWVYCGLHSDSSKSSSTYSKCNQKEFRGDVKIPTYKPRTNHKKPSVSSHTLAPTTICDLSHSVCRSPLADLGHISSVTNVCHPLWFVCGHRKGILMSPLTLYEIFNFCKENLMSSGVVCFCLTWCLGLTVCCDSGLGLSLVM